VEVHSVPPGADVSVADKGVGVTPATISLEVPATILVSRAGYQPLHVRIERGGPITVRLVPSRRPRKRLRAAGETLD
jgi:hypothetical protein